MKDKLVTLIGGGGFVGRYVAQALLESGARVRIAQRDPRQAYFLRTQGGLGQTQFVAVDIRKPDSIARAVHGADAVVNLVGVLAGDFTAAHVDGARHVAQACAAANVPALVHVSAIGADPEAQSRYGKSKGDGEIAVRAAFPHATILRPSIIFGREDQFINRFARLIATEGVHAYQYLGKRYDCGSKQGFLEATVEFALRHPEVGPAFQEYLKTVKV